MPWGNTWKDFLLSLGFYALFRREKINTETNIIEYHFLLSYSTLQSDAWEQKTEILNQSQNHLLKWATQPLEWRDQVGTEKDSAKDIFFHFFLEKK